MRNLIRLALKAGNFREIFRLSREARALENLNSTGGISGPKPSQRDRGDYRTDAFLSDPDFRGRERYVDPFAPNRLRDPNAATEYYGMLPDGRRLQFNPQTGSRSTFFPQSSNPIEAPYEGMRVWPPSHTAPPGPWMGAGRPPSYSDFPTGRGPESIFQPSAGWQVQNFNVPRAFGGMYDGFPG